MTFDSAVLEAFVTLASDDPTKTDLELTHAACGEVVCDVEDGDNLFVLAQTAAEHIKECKESM